MMNSKESSKLLESWFRFWAEAVGSPQSSLESWQNINQLSSQSAAFQQWVAQFWPGVDAGTARSATQALEQWTQEWQRVMGVVPRSRYLELLEENDNLRHRLRQAEEQIARLETRKGETAVSRGDRAKNVRNVAKLLHRNGRYPGRLAKILADFCH